MTDLTEDFWDGLLKDIADRDVIPIVGPALTTVTVGDREISLYRYIAERLAGRVHVPVPERPEGVNLNDVVCRFLEKDGQKGQKEEIYRQVHALLEETSIAPSARLLDLAKVEGFSLFVTTTFDSLLTDAINAVRFDGLQETEEIAYSPSSKAKDLTRDGLDRPVVYHLLGKASRWPDYVVCDEDLLEFVHALCSPSLQPMRLLDELRNKHLLLLGCRFSDWMARFLIRIAKSQRLSQQRPQIEVLVGSEVSQDTNLVMFLQHYSYRSRVIPGRADTFVTELANRWEQRYPTGLPPQTAGSESEWHTDSEQMKAGAIFLSYAREDLAAVEQIKAALEKDKLEVWFDKSNLQAGDIWEQRIRHNIKSCSLFVAIISRSTQKEGFFRREWRWAVERSLDMADDIRFIIPASIDDTAADGLGIFEPFKRAQWARVSDDATRTEFAGRLKQLVREYHRRQ